MQPSSSSATTKKQKSVDHSKSSSMKKPMAKRHKANVTICCPFVYGSLAFWLGRKAQETQTHRWTLYVRGASGEDLSYLLSKVVFTLHSSFKENIREVTKPPFEVTEVGWGEFEANIKLFFWDTDQRPVEVLHFIRLYPDGGQPNTKKPVISEMYDEVVFTDPSPEFQTQLMEGVNAAIPHHPLQDYFPTYSDAEDVKRFTAAREFVHSEIIAAKNSLTILEEQIERLSQQSQRRS